MVARVASLIAMTEESVPRGNSGRQRGRTFPGWQQRQTREKRYQTKSRFPFAGTRLFSVLFLFLQLFSATLHYNSIFVPKSFRKSRIQSGWAGQAGAVTRLPSTQELETVAFTGHHLAPASTTSGCTAM